MVESWVVVVRVDHTIFVALFVGEAMSRPYRSAYATISKGANLVEGDSFDVDTR